MRPAGPRPTVAAAPTLTERLRKNSDVALAVGVVGILCLLVFRVPPGAMDYFLATNIAVSLSILLIALYIPNALKLPSFPTILLLATLFRLALNVGTTRLILLEANAGTIIDTFGKIAVGGNFVVGAVVFLVLVIVQFVVIAKGSERVAEVAARFTLDAMPGKQMSIDADLRAGLIDAEGARGRRQDLERESKLYGAMDGAMKFVKGDAIAGIIISLVNIVGGLVIGVTQQGMPLAEAAEVYSLLTIGDGLVSQIPALLVSVAAGLVVTRVAASTGAGSNLASEMLEQITGNPKGLLMAGAFLFATAVATIVLGIGLQPIPFLLLGGLLIAVGLSGRAKGAEEEVEGARGGATRAAEVAPGVAVASFAPHPLTLRIHPSLQPLLAGQDVLLRERQRELLARDRERRSRDLGLPFPPCAIVVDPRGLNAMEYAVQAYDAVIARGRIPVNQFFALCKPKDLEPFGIQATAQLYPGTRLTVSLLSIEARAIVDEKPELRERLGLRTPDQAVFEHVDRAARERADAFFGMQQAHQLIDAFERRTEAVVKAVIPKLLTLQPVSEVLRMLLQEQVPVRDLARIFDSLARWGEREKDPARLVELVRRDLGPALCNLAAAGAPKLRFYGLAPDVEELFSGGALSPTERLELVQLAARTIRPEAHLTSPPVVVTNDPQIRRAVWWVLRDRLPDVRVLSRESTAGYATEAITHLSLLAKPASGIPT